MKLLEKERRESYLCIVFIRLLSKLLSKYTSKPPTNTLTMNISKLIHGALIVALTGLLNMNLASAADAPKNLQGTWVGTIGKAKVRFCITEDDKFSSYYYEKYQEKISISVDKTTLRINELEGESFFKEDDEVNARMELTQQNDRLEGTWTTKSKQVQIRLRKQKNNANSALATEVREAVDYYGCEYIFYEPIITRFLSTHKRTTGNILNVDKYADDPANPMGYAPRYLKFIDPMLRSAVINSYELSIRKFEFWTSVVLEHETAEYLSLTMTARYWAGGAHPSSRLNGLLLRKDGRVLDVASLLKTETEESTEKILGLFRLGELVEDCDLNRSDFKIRVHAPTKDGLAFAPKNRNDLSDCSLPQTIPWSQIQPYLSNTGLRVMKDFTK